MRYKPSPLFPVLAILASTLLLVSASPSRADLQDNNVVIVLDASGSMAGNIQRTPVVRMDAAKYALKEVLKDLPHDTNIGLLVFGASNLANDWVYPLAPRDNERLMAAIDLPIPNGSTPLGAYIKKGADRLLTQRQEQMGYGSYRLLVVTDGEASDGVLMEKHVPDVLSRGIIVDVIGVDMKSDHTLATKVHTYRRADDPDTLKEAISQVFAELSDSGTDTADTNAFEQIAGIPDEMATAMLQALSTSGNHLIGEAPPAPKAEPDVRPMPPSGSPAPPGDTAPESATTWNLKTLLFLLIVGIVVVSWMRKKIRLRS